MKGKGGVRPLTSKIETALFNILKGRLAGKSFLDLFAGTGRAGLRALKEGAERVVFVEKDFKLARSIEEKLHKEGWREKGKVMIGEVSQCVKLLAWKGEKFDFIFLDPPFGSGLGDKTLSHPQFPLPFHPDTLGIIRQHWREVKEEIPGFVIKERKRYGETCLTFFSLKENGGSL